MQIVDTLIQGVLLGGLYALYAAGLSLIFGVMRLVNLAHGDFIVLAAYGILWIATTLGLPFPYALLIALPLLFVFGYVLQRVILNRTLTGDLLVPLLVTFGLSIIIQNGLLEAFSANTRRLSLGSFGQASLSISGNIHIGTLPLVTFLAAVAVILLLSVLFYRTRVGRMLRATSDSTEVVQLMGINPHYIFGLAMGIAFVVIGVAAFFMGARANFNPSAGPTQLLYAFEAVVIGGLGSLWGTLAGGIILGLSQAIGGAINVQWQLLAGHVVFLVIILLRPRGFFPKQ